VTSTFTRHVDVLCAQELVNPSNLFPLIITTFFAALLLLLFARAVLIPEDYNARVQVYVSTESFEAPLIRLVGTLSDVRVQQKRQEMGKTSFVRVKLDDDGGGDAASNSLLSRIRVSSKVAPQVKEMMRENAERAARQRRVDDVLRSVGLTKWKSMHLRDVSAHETPVAAPTEATLLLRSEEVVVESGLPWQLLRQVSSVFKQVVRRHHVVLGIFIAPHDARLQLGLPQRVLILGSLMFTSLCVSALLLGRRPENTQSRLFVGFIAALFMIPCRVLLPMLYKAAHDPPRVWRNREEAAIGMLVSRSRALSRFSVKSKRCSVVPMMPDTPQPMRIMPLANIAQLSFGDSSVFSGDAADTPKRASVDGSESGSAVGLHHSLGSNGDTVQSRSDGVFSPNVSVGASGSRVAGSKSDGDHVRPVELTTAGAAGGQCAVAAPPPLCTSPRVLPATACPLSPSATTRSMLAQLPPRSPAQGAPDMPARSPRQLPPLRRDAHAAGPLGSDEHPPRGATLTSSPTRAAVASAATAAAAASTAAAADARSDTTGAFVRAAGSGGADATATDRRETLAVATVGVGAGAGTGHRSSVALSSTVSSRRASDGPRRASTVDLSLPTGAVFVTDAERILMVSSVVVRKDVAALQPQQQQQHRSGGDDSVVAVFVPKRGPVMASLLGLHLAVSVIVAAALAVCSTAPLQTRVCVSHAGGLNVGPPCHDSRGHGVRSAARRQHQRQADSVHGAAGRRPWWRVCVLIAAVEQGLHSLCTSRGAHDNAMCGMPKALSRVRVRVRV
jgi:hypothetical protein